MKMKNINIRYLFTITVLALSVAGCYEDDFKDGKIQSVDSQGNVQKIISTAVTSTANDEFYANAVDASTSSKEFSMIPVVLNSKDLASEDIHVTMVPALDSLAKYNTKHGTNYVMPGAAGTPAFTLIDGGVVTIPAGSNVGYLKIKTVSADYFGSTQYAFAYKIGSVQESGYTVSGNHVSGIVALIPKNDFDGVYANGPGEVKRDTGGVPNTGDALQGPYTSVPDANLVTTGKYTLYFNFPLWATGGGIAGIDNTVITVSPTIVGGKQLVTMSCLTNPSMVNMPGEINDYDPATKTFRLAFRWGTANGRSIKCTLKYKGSR